jgi:hypothetical protein
MARPKKGMRVWQCSICGYWSERRRNADRHNNSIHGGSSTVLPAHAALVTEPSYQVMPLGASPLYNNATPSSSPLHVVAFDTRRTGNWNYNTPIRGNGKVEKNEPFDPIEFAISQIDQAEQPLLKLKRLKEKINEYYNLAQKVTGDTGHNNFHPFSPMTMMTMTAAVANNPATAITQHTYQHSVGFKGAISDKCFNVSGGSIPNQEERPATCEPTPLESHHNCKAELQFESIQEQLDKKRKQERALTDTLISDVKRWLHGKKIVLVAKKLDYEPPTKVQLFKYDAKSPVELISRVVKAGAIEINDEELHEFLATTRTTAAVFEAVDAGSTTYYTISVQGQLREAVEADHILDRFLKREILPKGQVTTYKNLSFDSSNHTDKNEIRSVSSSGLFGLKAMICETCLEPYLTLVSLHPISELKQPLHPCAGENAARLFDSDAVRADHKRRSEDKIVELLVKSIRVFYPEGKIALAAVNTKLHNLGPKGEQQLAIKHNIGKDHEYYISRAIREEVTVLNDDTELQDFFKQTRATYGLYEIAETGDQYAVFIYGSVKEEENVSSNSTENRVTALQENKTTVVPCLDIMETINS